MKKKTISLLMAASLAASSLAGGIVSFAEESDPITLSVWAPFTGSDGDVLREIIDNYNETNTDNITVQIDIMDNATLQSKLPTAVSTGTGPSFVLVGIESYVGDTQYGVPMQYNLQYLYYNKDIFEAAGLDPETPPTTLDELKEDAIACTDASKNQYGIGIPYDYASYCEYLWANGGDVISTDGKENLLNSQENIDTLTWLQDLAINEGVSPEGLTAADADTMFQAGQLAMYTSGPWNINGLNQLGVNYGITAIPAGSAGAFSPEGGCSYMLSDATLKEWSNRNGFPVWSYSVLEDEDIKANEILSNVSKASEIGRDWHLNLTIGSQIDSDVMQPMMEKILAGEDVAENVKAASDILDGIIAAQ